MTVQELINKLMSMPPHAEVYVSPKIYTVPADSPTLENCGKAWCEHNEYCARVII